MLWKLKDTSIEVSAQLANALLRAICKGIDNAKLQLPRAFAPLFAASVATANNPSSMHLVDIGML